jgi:hypothetical protein
MSWMRWRKQHKTEQCVPLAIGMELLEIAELLSSRFRTRTIRNLLKLPRT